jgi:ABC-type multidrug transport system fused ATPase/permease subunit
MLVASRSRRPPPRRPGAPGRRSSDKPGDLHRAARLLRRFLRGQRKTFLLAIVVLVFEAATAVFEPYPLAYLIDFLREQRPALELPFMPVGTTSTIAALTLAILLIAMVNSAADSWGEILLAREIGRASCRERV